MLSNSDNYRPFEAVSGAVLHEGGLLGLRDNISPTVLHSVDIPRRAGGEGG